MYEFVSRSNTVAVHHARFCVLFQLLGVFFACLCCSAAPPARAAGDKNAGQSETAKVPLLIALQDRAPNDDRSVAVFDFGTRSLVDTAAESLFEPERLDFSTASKGLKHIFSFKNTSNQAIEIIEDRANCFLEVRVWRDKEKEIEDKLVRFPYTVLPGAEVKFIVVLDPADFIPGRITATTRLYGQVAPAPRIDAPDVDILAAEKAAVKVASLTMTGNLNSGITLSTTTLDFGKLAPGQGATRDFTVTFDRNLPFRLVPGARLRMMTSTPDVSIAAVAGPKIKGVKINGDAVILSAGARALMRAVGDDDDGMEADATVTYRVTLAKNASIGRLTGQVGLIVEGFPLFLITSSARLTLQGAIIGHLQAAPLDSFVFDRVTQRVEKRLSTNIYLAAPVARSDLTVSVDHRYVTATLGKAAPLGSVDKHGKLSTLIGPATAVIPLNVTLSPNAPPGHHLGSIVIARKNSVERLRLNVSATVLGAVAPGPSSTTTTGTAGEIPKPLK